MAHGLIEKVIKNIGLFHSCTRCCAVFNGAHGLMSHFWAVCPLDFELESEDSDSSADIAQLVERFTRNE